MIVGQAHTIFRSLAMSTLRWHSERKLAQCTHVIVASILHPEGTYDLAKWPMLDKGALKLAHIIHWLPQRCLADPVSAKESRYLNVKTQIVRSATGARSTCINSRRVDLSFVCSLVHSLYSIPLIPQEVKYHGNTIRNKLT